MSTRRAESLVTSNFPIKKTYDFYKTQENLWNSRYLTSPKITKYYHAVNDAYLLGPNSPSNLSLQESLQSNLEHSAKASSHIQESKYRLKMRAIERKNLQWISKQIPYDNSREITPIKAPLHDSPINLSAWEKLNTLPASKLKHIIPQKIIDNDLKSVGSIYFKEQLQDREKELSDDQRQVAKLRVKLFTLQRHNYLKTLEFKSGIEKVRVKSGDQGIFGYVKEYKTSTRTHELSLPRKIKKKSVFDNSDFRGLLHADFKPAVSQLEKRHTDLRPTNLKPRAISPSLVSSTLLDISDFELKLFHKTQN